MRLFDLPGRREVERAIPNRLSGRREGHMSRSFEFLWAPGRAGRTAGSAFRAPDSSPETSGSRHWAPRHHSPVLEVGLPTAWKGCRRPVHLGLGGRGRRVPGWPRHPHFAAAGEVAGGKVANMGQHRGWHLGGGRPDAEASEAAGSTRAGKPIPGKETGSEPPQQCAHGSRWPSVRLPSICCGRRRLGGIPSWKHSRRPSLGDRLCQSGAPTWEQCTNRDWAGLRRTSRGR